jgi:hypothetical protein
MESDNHSTPLREQELRVPKPENKIELKKSEGEDSDSPNYRKKQ